MKRMICKAKCTGFGSALSSPKCGLERGYIEFEINGKKYRAWESQAMETESFTRDKEYDLSFFTPLPGINYLKRCKPL